MSKISVIMNSWNQVLLEPLHCFDAVLMYVNGKANDEELHALSCNAVQLRAKQHLLALGWKIERRVDKVVRFRFESPEGKCYYSLFKVCCGLVNQRLNLDDDLQSSNKVSVFVEDEVINSREESLCAEDDAVKKYQEFIETEWRTNKRELSNSQVKMMRIKAKEQLLQMGWSIFMQQKKLKSELVYKSPWGRLYNSLNVACKEYLRRNFRVNFDAKNAKFVSTGDNIGSSQVEEKNCEVFRFSKGAKSSRKGKVSRVSASDSLNSCTSDGFCGSKSKRLKKCYSAARKNVGFNDVCTRDNVGSSRVEEKNCEVLRFSNGAKSSRKRKVSRGSLCDSLDSCTSDDSWSSKLKKQKKCCSSVRKNVVSKKVRSHVLRSSTRSKRVLESSSEQDSVKTVLSWLIGMKVVVSGQKVIYVCESDGVLKKEGLVYNEGIMCVCCNEVFSIAMFEAHAGERTKCPSANIFFDGGVSLLKYQRQMMEASKNKCCVPIVRLKGDYSHCDTDEICSICHDGGDLIICDYCPAAFHTFCVGLQAVPEGKWCCRTCKCGICGLGEYNSDVQQFKYDTMLYCDQCEKEYHVGCLRESRPQQLNSCPTGRWLCSDQCEQIFSNLHKLIGKSNPIADGNLSWTILRSSTESIVAVNDFHPDTMPEHHSKLSIALDILHECFEPLVEPLTQRELVDDIIFNSWSELQRLRFSGFYTICLQRQDEFICVATFRIHNEKVAEVPLVATRSRYRKQGMCHLLMGELEKLLSSLGVERLILPAVPQLVETWTKSFGFIEMESADVMALSKYGLLNFYGTVMCQKFLPTKKAIEEHEGSSAQLVKAKTNYNRLVGGCAKMYSRATLSRPRNVWKDYT